MKRNTVMFKDKKIIALVVALVLIILGVTFFAVYQVNKNTEMGELFALEKEEMENEYSTFATQYDELQVQISNDSLKEKLMSEKIKTQRLLEELRQVKTTNAQEIMRLKKELKTVRAVLRSYVIQIDSLNKINEKLTQENREVKNKYTSAQREITSLAKEKKDLHEKVNLAAQLDVTNIKVNPTNKRGRTTSKVKDVKKFSISFTIVKNITAQTGNKPVYIRIAKPGNDVLVKNDTDTFDYGGTKLNYSIKKYIEYTGEEQEVTVYWDVQEFLTAGQYRVYVFADGNMIGESSFNLR